MDKVNKEAKTTIFGENLKRFAEKNHMDGQDIAFHFGWHTNAFRNYTVDGNMPGRDKMVQIVQKTNTSIHEWWNTLLSDDEIPLVKFYTTKQERETQIAEEDAEEYGPLAKLDLSGLNRKLTDMEIRIRALEKQLHIAKE